MPIYEYKCKVCHRHKERFAISPSTQLQQECCNQPMGRVFSFTAGNIMHEHFDPSVGRAISSERQLLEHGKLLSEESHARTGLDTNYVLADVTDKKQMGVTDEGLAEQAKAHHDMGNTTLGKRIEKLI